MKAIPKENKLPNRFSTVSLPDLVGNDGEEREGPGRRFEKRTHGGGGRKIGIVHGVGHCVERAMESAHQVGNGYGTGCAMNEGKRQLLKNPKMRKLTPAIRKTSPASGPVERKISNLSVTIERQTDQSERKTSSHSNGNSLTVRKISGESTHSGHTPVERKISSKRDRKLSRLSAKTESGSQGCSRSSSMKEPKTERKMSTFQKTMHQFTMVHLDLGSIKDGSIFDKFVPKKSPQILAALAATIGAFGMGTVMAWSSPALPKLKDDPVLQPSVEELSWIASLVPLAAALAGPPTGKCIEKIGRRPTMIALSVPFVLGWLLIAFALNIPMMLIGRGLTGFCAGAFSLTAPVFISETAEDSIRGTLGSGFQLMVTLGILFSYVLGAFVDWKWLAIISASVPVIMCLLMIYVPASPRYLLTKGRLDDATKALMWFRGAENPDQVQEELNLIQTSIDEAREKKVTCTDFFSPSILKPLSVSLGLMFFQSFSGTDAVTFYTVDIFQDAGSTLDDNLATIIVGGVQVLATFLSLILVDKAGRRALLLVSDLFMAVALFALGTYFFLGPETKIVCSMLPLVSLILFVTAYSIGFGPVPWMMMGEVLPNHVIGSASAIATSFNWICTFVIIRFFGDVKMFIGSNWSYITFGTFCIVGIFYVFLFVPETKGKSLDEIQAMFTKTKRPIRDKNRRMSRTTVDSYFFA